MAATVAIIPFYIIVVSFTGTVFTIILRVP